MIIDYTKKQRNNIAHMITDLTNLHMQRQITQNIVFIR